MSVTSSQSGTRHPATGTLDPRPLVALDFGDSGKLALYGERGDGTVGPIPVPRLKPRGRGLGARSAAEKFADRLAELLQEHDVVTESATVGSSGADPELLDAMLATSPGRVWTLPNRAMKNWVRDHGLEELQAHDDKGDNRASDAQSAEVQYRIAVSNPAALRPYVSRTATPFSRRFTSVRPFDKRGYVGVYAGTDIGDWIAVLPDVGTLPTVVDPATGTAVDLAALLADNAGVYRRALVFPFALALAEAPSGTRSGYEKVLGLYGHGYPSFYRRATVTLMQATALAVTGHERMTQVSAAERKVAWRLTRRALRYLWHHADRPAA